jgi:hypothetical protein
VTETYLTMTGVRERGWTDAMIREYLGEPDATRPNPRYSSAAPMKLYLAERAEVTEASPDWGERMTRGARRRAAGVAVAGRRRAETEVLARQLAADLVASLILPAHPELTGYDRAYDRLVGRVGHQDAHEILRSEVNAAIEAKLAGPGHAAGAEAAVGAAGVSRK